MPAPSLLREEQDFLLGQDPPFENIMASLSFAPKLPRGIVEETRYVVALARKFNREVVRPLALALDRKLHKEPDFLPWEFVRAASDWGLYTLWIPRIFGGQGMNMSSLSHFMEEIASECLAMANLVGVHYLGVGTLSSSYNAALMKKVYGDVVEGWKKGEPRLISLAITEPGAGTDVEEVDLVDKGTVTCHARRVEGGYVVNGTKVFISNGHLSRWHMLICYQDLEKPSENTVMMAVKTGAEGFRFGRHEKKMGQRACPASELIFENCFVPDDQVAMRPEDLTSFTRGARGTCMQAIDYVVSTSRPAVGAFGTGAARGAYQKALDYASRTVVGGKLLINHEWAQCLLAEMYKNVSLARLAYVETNYQNSLCGAFKDVHTAPMYHLNKIMPEAVIRKVAGPYLEKPAATATLRKRTLEGQTDCEIHRTSGWASLAKIAGTDYGVKNCHLALELMGGAGVRQDNGAEKILRDAKLLQIYEGTNQLNRLNLFKCMAACTCEDACVFED